jgi:hypothetical protein
LLVLFLCLARVALEQIYRGQIRERLRYAGIGR